MNTIKSLLLTLFLSLALMGSALAAGKLDINTASATQLADTMSGVGLAKAEAIIAYRTENGPFKSIDQLTQVKGIGLKTVEKNRELIEVGQQKPASKS